MSWRKIKLTPADKVFSDYIRERAGWCCEYCHKDLSRNKQNLHCSHFWNRGRENTRYDTENCIALCAYHHDNLGHGDERSIYTELMKKRLGIAGYEKLMLRAHIFKRKDRKMSLIIAKKLLQEVKNGQNNL